MIDYIVVAGNTTMTHLFYGIDPQHIRERLISLLQLFSRSFAGRASASNFDHRRYLLHAERGQLCGR